MKIAQRYFVSGKVQGVGYRRFVQRRAEALGLHGWTRNLIDGRVEVFAEGTIELLGSLAEILRKGPAFSVVENLEIRDSEATNLNGFEIHPDGDPR